MRFRHANRFCLSFILATVIAVAPAAAAVPAGAILGIGSNIQGQLGNPAFAGSPPPENTWPPVYVAPPGPLPVLLPLSAGSAVEAAVGGNHSLVITSSGRLYAFGSNHWGELGSAVNCGSAATNATPAPVSLPGQLGTPTHVAAGFSVSLVVTSAGQLYSLGVNEDGPDGSTAGAPANCQPRLVSLPGAVDPVNEVAAGSDHNLAVTSGDQLYAWGGNYGGQLGSTAGNGVVVSGPGPYLPQYPPARVRLPGQTGRVVQVAGGGWFSLALTATGQLYAFGDNESGQLGSPVNDGFHPLGAGPKAANPIPTLVSLPGLAGTITHISAGADHTLVVTSSGQLYAFGGNDFGQLGSSVNMHGLGPALSAPNPTPTLVRLPGEVGPVVQASAGNGYSLAVTASGQLYAFGNNTLGLFGPHASDDQTPHPQPTLVAGGSGSTFDTAITIGKADHALLLVSDLRLTSGSLPVASVGSGYRATVGTAGGAAPVLRRARNLPRGLTFDVKRSIIRGRPHVAGTSRVVLSATDRYGIRTTRTYKLTVRAACASRHRHRHRHARCRLR
ncbi:MAG: putative Ig domain-containing protein [Actinomycetota bacterium]|nr:putative Ig domain-containing protein [Actinomycetota bacterium]